MESFSGLFVPLDYIVFSIIDLITLIINFLTPEEINALLVISSLYCTFVLIIYYHTVPEDEKKKMLRKLKNSVRQTLGLEEINDGGDDIK